MPIITFFRSQRIAIFGLLVLLAVVYAILFGRAFIDALVYPDWLIAPNLLLTFICLIVIAEVISTAILVPIDSNRIFIYGLAVAISLVVLFFVGYLATHKHD